MPVTPAKPAKTPLKMLWPGLSSCMVFPTLKKFLAIIFFVKMPNVHFINQSLVFSGELRK